MTRKKHRNHRPEASPLPTAVASDLAEVPAAPLPSTPDAAPDDPLLSEVQSFLSKRAELAQKMADEIAATEKKLAELKETAALLFPEHHGNGPKERKPKKAKPKAANRESKTEPPIAPGDSPPADASDSA
jgi:hypothetical protein